MRIIKSILSSHFFHVFLLVLQAPQHFLYFRPLPQGQGSLRPTFSSFGRGRPSSWARIFMMPSAYWPRRKRSAMIFIGRSTWAKKALSPLHSQFNPGSPSDVVSTRFFGHSPWQVKRKGQSRQYLGSDSDFARPNDRCFSEETSPDRGVWLMFPRRQRGSTK